MTSSSLCGHSIRARTIFLAIGVLMGFSWGLSIQSLDEDNKIAAIYGFAAGLAIMYIICLPFMLRGMSDFYIAGYD